MSNEMSLSEVCQYVVSKATEKVAISTDYLASIDNKLLAEGPSVIFDIPDTEEIFAIKSEGDGLGKYTEDPDELQEAIVIRADSKTCWNILAGYMTPDIARFSYDAISITNTKGGDELPVNREVAWRICIMLFDFMKAWVAKEGFFKEK